MSKIEGQSSVGGSTQNPGFTAAPEGVNERTMKRITAQFAAGVVVVTTRHAGGLHGLTISAFSTVSWEPPLALICLENLSQSCEFIKVGGFYAVNILSDRQEFLAERFAGRAPLVNSQFDGVPHHFEATGAPILDGVLGWLDCQLERVIEAGDHTMFIGRVVRLGEGDVGSALVYFARNYRSVEP